MAVILVNNADMMLNILHSMMKLDSRIKMPKVEFVICAFTKESMEHLSVVC